MSILTIVSKILERVTCNQIESYIQIRFQMDRGFHTGVVMIDLQKAFDTVDHDISLQKLKAHSFDYLTNKWFESYLEGRNK